MSLGDSRVTDKKAAGEGEENSGNKKGTVSCRCSGRYMYMYSEWLDYLYLVMSKLLPTCTCMLIHLQGLSGLITNHMYLVLIVVITLHM